MWNFCLVDRYDSSVSITRLSDTRTHVQNNKPACTLTHSTHAHPCTHIHKGGSSVLLLWAEAIIIVVFFNTIPYYITPGLAALWHSAIWRVCVFVCQSVSECKWLNVWESGWYNYLCSVTRESMKRRRKADELSDEDRYRTQWVEFIHVHTRYRAEVTWPLHHTSFHFYSCVNMEVHWQAVNTQTRKWEKTIMRIEIHFDEITLGVRIKLWAGFERLMIIVF